MEELLTKYRVNLNDYSEEYDLVAFLCKDCAEGVKKHNPFKYKHGGYIPLSKVKIIEIDREDCDKGDEIVSIPLYTEGLTDTFTVTIEETISQDFEIVAADSKTAIEIAKERYYNGDVVLDAAEVHTKKIATTKPITDSTTWVEF